MKAFWAVLLLLIMGSVAYLALGRDGGRAAAPKNDAPPAPIVEIPRPTPRTAGQKDNDEAAFFPDAPAPAANLEAAKAPEAPTNETAAPTPAVPAEVTGPAENTNDTASTPAPTAPAVNPATEAAKVDEPAPALAETKNEKPAAEEVGALPTPPPAVTPPAPPPSGSGVSFGADAKVVKNDDGSLMIDDKFPLKGEGTKEKPYEITWEFLISAQEDYQPRLGKKKLPGRMKLVTGKYVKITGFVAFPIMATEPTEMLAMLNQWDGCCIGIPPTPYDAIEVKLKEPASNDERLITYSAVEGKLTVEPYLVRDWLVSLYTMDEATMQRAQ